MTSLVRAAMTEGKWPVSPLDRLRRFLVLGTDANTFYATARELSEQVVACVLEPCIRDDTYSLRVLHEIDEVLAQNRAPRAEPAVFALAYITVKCREHANVRARAFELACKHFNIPTMLFQFLEFRKTLCASTSKCMGRQFRTFLSQWYMRYDKPQQFAYHVTKYAQRHGWTHLDALRVGHVKFPQHKRDLLPVILYLKHKSEYRQKIPDEMELDDDDVAQTISYLDATLEAKRDGITEERLVELVRQYGFVREHMPTGHLRSVPVWQALLEKMPVRAMVRNLGRMTNVGVFDNEESVGLVQDRLSHKMWLESAKMHPFTLFLARAAYDAGGDGSGKTNLKWTPNSCISDALGRAFEHSFAHVEPTHLQYTVAVDVSPSMQIGGHAAGITPARAAHAIAYILCRIEPHVHLVAFSNMLTEYPTRARQSLESMHHARRAFEFSSTDCSLPMRDATTKKRDVDVFVVLTDSETNTGPPPRAALAAYRTALCKPRAKLMVAAFTSGECTIADPADTGMTDFVGFDAAFFEVLREFALRA